MQTDKYTLAGGQTRLHALDAVRAFALLLGVVLHATMSFFPGPRLWLVDDSEGSVLLSATFFVIHMLRMTTFFLVAGFVARLSFDNLGAAAFFKDRLRRIGVPLVVGWPILFVALMAAAGMPATAIDGVTFAYFPLIHLWFLYLLALSYMAIALVHPLLALSGANRIARLLLRPWAVVPLAAPLCLSLYLHPYWMMWFGIPTPDHGWLPNLPAIAGYGVAFAFGWLAQRQREALGIWKRHWIFNLLLACGCTAFCLFQAGAAPLLMPVPQGSMKLAYAASYSLGAWSWALALIGMAQRFLSAYGRVRRYLADASYWIYLVHLPLVVLLQGMVAQLAWHWSAKFAVILAAAFPLMLGSYSLFVRRTVVGAILNGRKRAASPTNSNLESSSCAH
ncbi:acyltransferase family protein [Massilia glaciei]|uniref:Acyltransferase n=1 Tax=Massilia glaciei TaxID=1524097 RepID=A0A2U2I6D2_9BURK|nr:acyltransferase family protein [Massilia glaciei]PWF55316.1 acyltransferase [Massilia glaciei]